MDRSKKLYLLLGILAAACVATLGVMHMEQRQEQIRDSGEIILELSCESVQFLSWEYGETALAFHRDGGWVYDGDENFPVSEERINALLEPFQAFGAAFVIEEVEDFGQYGLDAPALTITVEYTAQEEGGGEGKDVFVLHVSPDPEDVKAAQQTQEGDEKAEISAYIRVGESQIVYKISSANYKKVAAASYDDLRHPQVIWADFSDVRQLDVSLEEEHYTFTSQQEGDERAWSYQGEEFEMAGLRNDLTALSAQEFTSQQPAQKEEIRLTVHLDHENISQIEIALYRYDAARCLAVVDGESVSLVDRAAVVELIEAVHAIVLN